MVIRYRDKEIEMTSKKSQWFKAIVIQSGHTANAARAENALPECVGKGRVVEKHLRKISKRERAIAAFVGHVANGLALNDDDE
jgi:hypothetical protein